MITKAQNDNFNQLLTTVKIVSKSTNETIYSGIGRVWRESGRFQVECALDYLDKTGTVFSTKTYKSGQLISKEDLSDLVAVCIDGTNFVLRDIHFSPFIPSHSLTMTEDSRLAWIGSDYPVPETANELHITYPFTLSCFRRFSGPPCDKLGTITREFINQRWRFKNGIAKIDIYQSSIVIRIKTIDNQNIDRLIQCSMMALSFASGCNARFSKVIVKNGSAPHYSILSAVDNHVDSNKMLGPCAALKLDPIDAINMIKIALTAAIEDEGNYIKIFSHALSITQSRTAYPEDYASACSRALEFLCHTYKDKEINENKPLDVECAQIQDALDLLDIPLMKLRIYGILNNPNQFSASNFLKDAENNKFIPEGTHSAFKTIRHRVAHGTIFDEKGFEKAHWNVELLKDAFYELALRKLGYKGNMVQYSIPGWPLKDIS